MEGYRRGKYGMQCPVHDGLAQDEVALAAFESVLPDMWRSECERAGGIPIGPVTIERTENMLYGWEIGIGEDGEPVVDDVRLWIRASGPAWEPMP